MSCCAAHLYLWQRTAHLLVVLKWEPHVLRSTHHRSPLAQAPDQLPFDRGVKVPVMTAVSVLLRWTDIYALLKQ